MWKILNACDRLKPDRDLENGLLRKKGKTVKKNESYHTQKKWKWRMFHVCALLGFLLVMLSGMGNAQAEDWQIEGQDGIFANGSLQPKAKTAEDGWQDDSSENALKLYRNGVAAYYGGQLETANEQAVYTELIAAQQQNRIKGANSRYHAIEIILEKTVVLPETDGTQSAAYRTLCSEVGKAIDAFLFDYNENYWIYGYRWMPNGTSNRISKIQMWFTDYYSDIRSEMNLTDEELSRLEQKVTGNSRYEVVKKAYEEVIRLVTYPTDDRMAYHTITGGLLEKYSHKGVCDCYARLFKLLCQKKGIACILVPGGSDMIDGEVQMDHIWNYVQMEDGKWYLVDCTWDDLGTSTPRMTHFLAGYQTPGLYSETVGQNHLAVGRFTSSSYTPFSVPQLSATAYRKEGSYTSVPLGAYFTPGSLTMDIGKREKLTATIYPASVPTDELKWNSSNAAVANIIEVGGADQAYITAKGAGTAQITLSYGTKVMAACQVTVKGKQTAAASYKISLNVTSLPMQVKKSTKALKVTSLQAGDSIKVWKSSNSKVVKVDRRTGKLTALRKGTAVITVTSQKGAKASCKIKVQKGKVATKKIRLKKTCVELKKGKSFSIKYTRTPLTANDKLSYKTSNKKVATVSASGKVKAKKKGTATITVRSASGKTAKLKIKVR